MSLTVYSEPAAPGGVPWHGTYSDDAVMGPPGRSPCEPISAADEAVQQAALFPER